MTERLFPNEVDRFERCEYAIEEFGHSEHLKVAWTYLQLHGYEVALSKMREGLLRFSAHHKKMGYNETITVFWMRKLHQHCEDDPVELFQNSSKEVLFRHFSRERVMGKKPNGAGSNPIWWQCSCALRRAGAKIRLSLSWLSRAQPKSPHDLISSIIRGSTFARRMLQEHYSSPVSVRAFCAQGNHEWQ